MMTPEIREKLERRVEVIFDSLWKDDLVVCLAEIDRLTAMNANLSKAATMAVDELDLRDDEIDRLNSVVDQAIHHSTLGIDPKRNKIYNLRFVADAEYYPILAAELERRSKA